MSDLTLLYALLRSDLSAFTKKVFHTVAPGDQYLHNWHIETVAYHLMLIEQGKIKRLIITLPPRSLKSICTSVAFTAWTLGHDPTRKILCTSYAQDLATKHSLDTRAVMESDWYRACFPGTRTHPDKNSQTEFMTTTRGQRLATSVGGSLTGRGGNLIIIDDPHKAEEALSDSKREATKEWYRTTLLSRLDSKQNDAIILIQQRLHEDDLAGYLLETGEWYHLNLPAIAEEEEHIPLGRGRVHIRQPGEVLHSEREPRATLDAIQSDFGSYAFAAQYQQRPTPMGGGIIKWAWFKTYDTIPEKGDFHLVVQSWDTACKAESIHDWSVCTTWLIYKKNWYLLHVLRARLEFPDLKKRIVSQAKEWQTDMVLIEDKGAGTQLIQDLRRDTSLNIVDYMPKDDKETRMMMVTPSIEAGKVWIPTDAPWLADFQYEILHFPKGKYDDQVDSLSQFLHWAHNRREPIGPDAPFLLISSSVMDSSPCLVDPSMPAPSLVDDIY